MLQVHEENMKRNGDTVTVQSIGAALHSMYRQNQMQWKTHREGQSNERSKENRKPSENRVRVRARSEEGTDNEIALSSVMVIYLAHAHNGTIGTMITVVAAGAFTENAIYAVKKATRPCNVWSSPSTSIEDLKGGPQVCPPGREAAQRQKSRPQGQ
jgi:hypothetical protein